jgi:hypothetical protein
MLQDVTASLWKCNFYSVKWISVAPLLSSLILLYLFCKYEFASVTRVIESDLQLFFNLTLQM